MKCLKSFVLLCAFAAAFLLAAGGSAVAQNGIQLELVSAKTADGIVLNGLIWTPAEGKAKIGVVMIAGTYAEFYDLPFDWMGQKLAENGYLAISMNRRDHGLEFGYHNMEPAACRPFSDRSATADVRPIRFRFRLSCPSDRPSF